METAYVGGEVAATLNSGGNDGGFRTEPGEHLVAFVKAGRAQTENDDESWREGVVTPTLNGFDVGDARATTLAVMGTLREHVRPGSNTDHTVLVPDVTDTLRVGTSEGNAGGGAHAVPIVGQNDGIADTLLAPTDGGRRDKVPVALQEPGGDAVVEPDGLDSHRYRCCGNGVVTPVAEWLGWRLRAHVERHGSASA